MSEDVVVRLGAGACCEALSKCFMDGGDTILIPEPCFMAFEHFFENMNQVNIHTFKWDDHEFSNENDLQSFPQEVTKRLRITETVLENALHVAKEKNQKIKCLLITNPDNPTGNILDRNSIQTCIDFCNKHKLNFISDEIYMASIHEAEADFVSVLQLGPQSENIHFVWSFSKDFGVSGFRVGVVVTKNKAFKEYARTDLNQSVSTAAQYLMELLITDSDWLNQVFFPENQKRLRQRYEYVRDELLGVGIACYPASGGLYLWADFSGLLKGDTEEDEEKLFDSFIRAGICMLPASVSKSTVYGHFRIVFSLQWDILKLAMIRLKKCVAMLRMLQE